MHNSLTSRLTRIFGRKTAAGIIVLVLIAAAASASFAYLAASGSAAGSASTGALQPVTVNALVAGDSNSGTLLPGGTADVVLRVKNPNASAVTLLSVTGGPGAITADANHPGCTTTGVSFTNQTGLSTTVAASGTTLVRLPNAASMSSSSSNGCQGATFSVPVSITVKK